MYRGCVLLDHSLLKKPMYGECVLSDHGLLLFTKNNTCGERLFYFSSDYLMKKKMQNTTAMPIATV